LFVALVLAGCSQQGGVSGGAIPPYSDSKEYSPPAIYSQLIGIRRYCSGTRKSFLITR